MQLSGRFLAPHSSTVVNKRGTEDSLSFRNVLGMLHKPAGAQNKPQTTVTLRVEEGKAVEALNALLMDDPGPLQEQPTSVPVPSTYDMRVNIINGRFVKLGLMIRSDRRKPEKSQNSRGIFKSRQALTLRGLESPRNKNGKAVPEALKLPAPSRRPGLQP